MLRIPLSTYRLQFNQSFTFHDAVQVIPYLSALGITDCYASPYLKAVPQSAHGYDIVDPTSLNPELGTTSDYQEFVATLQAHAMGHLVDIVPNHLGIADSCNPWWQDVLENGLSSPYAFLFDIDWNSPNPELHHKILLPILGDQYRIVLENQEINVCYQDGEFFLRYYQYALPLDPQTWPLILTLRLDDFLKCQELTHPAIQEFQWILTALEKLPARNACAVPQVTERYREKAVIKERLAILAKTYAPIATFIEETRVFLNGQRGISRSFEALDRLLSNQVYCLASWRVASEEINYRRFFDINQLAAVRMEESWVFHEVHGLVCDLLRQGAITGLRIDHIDGLYDPQAYLAHWQQWVQKELGWSADSRGRALFVVVEKILGNGEPLCEHWPVHGTSGYDFLALVNGLFVAFSHSWIFDDLYAKFVQQDCLFEDMRYDCKQLIMRSSMSSEIKTLAHRMHALSEQTRHTSDFPFDSLMLAIQEIIACFPVYRTYISSDSREVVTDWDRACIRLAVTKAKQKNPTINALVFDGIQDLLLKETETGDSVAWTEVRPFVMRFQQTTGPVTAKGVEDTVFYRYNRLLSLNEVGSDPDSFGVPVSTFHERMQERQQRWPHSLSATSTHDTKRSEDIRARLNVLSELPKEWEAALACWHRLNTPHKRWVHDQLVPDRHEEYLLYQTLIGAWPFDASLDMAANTFCQRIQRFMLKALREAKVHTSWVNPEESYEQAVYAFIEVLLDTTTSNPFLGEFLPLQKKIAQYGLYNSLAQVVLKITAPGTPDFYQGTELWDFSLVDPDNRRPVDFACRASLLQTIRQSLDDGDRLETIKGLLETWTDGRIKLFLTTILLTFRKTHPIIFKEGQYLPLESCGEKSDHICAFARRSEAGTILSLVPRLLTTMIPNPNDAPLGPSVWGETMVVLPHEELGPRYRNIVTGAVLQTSTHQGQSVLSAAHIFHHLPVAVLEPIS